MLATAAILGVGMGIWKAIPVAPGASLIIVSSVPLRSAYLEFEGRRVPATAQAPGDPFLILFEDLGWAGERPRLSLRWTTADGVEGAVEQPVRHVADARHCLFVLRLGSDARPAPRRIWNVEGRLSLIEIECVETGAHETDGDR